MKVYVLETGVYEQTGVSGVYDSPERAMADAEGSWTKETTLDDDGTECVMWTNDKDWDAAARVYGYDLTQIGPERQPDQKRVQVYRPLDGGWAYLDESAESLRLAHDAHEYITRHRARGVWREPEPTGVDQRIVSLMAG